MYYSEEIIEEVRSRSDIVDIVGRYVKLTKRGNNYMGLCPFHNEKSGSFSVSQSKQMYHCFGCGVGGNVVTFLMEYERMTFPEAIKELAGWAGVKLPEVELSQEEKNRINIKNKLYEINKEAAKFFVYQLNSPAGKDALDYFKNRGLSSETIKKFGLGYASIDGELLYRYLKSRGYDDKVISKSGLVIMNERASYDRFRERVMYPIMDINNKVVGFGGRIMSGDGPKYLNSPETDLFEKSRILYGMNYAKSSRKSNIIICEGYMDVIALHQAGFDQAVAALGTAFTSAHANLIKKYTKLVLLTFDSDGAGVKAALRALPILKSAGLTVKSIDMSPYKDPDEFIKNLGPEEFQKRIDSATNSFMYKIDKLSGNYDLTDPGEKTQFINEVAKELADFQEEVERNNYIDAVANLYRVENESLRKLVEKIGNERELNVAQDNIEKENAKQKGRDDGVVKSQKILLTCLVNEPDLFPVISKYIRTDDFIDEIYNKAACAVYKQIEDVGRVNPAKIINMFEDEEAHKKVAGLFSEDIKEDISHNEKEKLLKETIVNVKKNSLEDRMSKYSQMTDEQKQRFIDDKTNLQRIKITL